MCVGELPHALRWYAHALAELRRLPSRAPSGPRRRTAVVTVAGDGGDTQQVIMMP